MYQQQGPSRLRLPDGVEAARELQQCGQHPGQVRVEHVPARLARVGAGRCQRARARAALGRVLHAVQVMEQLPARQAPAHLALKRSRLWRGDAVCLALALL